MGLLVTLQLSHLASKVAECQWRQWCRLIWFQYLPSAGGSQRSPALLHPIHGLEEFWQLFLTGLMNSGRMTRDDEGQKQPLLPLACWSHPVHHLVVEFSLLEMPGEDREARLLDGRSVAGGVSDRSDDSKGPVAECQPGSQMVQRLLELHWLL